MVSIVAFSFHPAFYPPKSGGEQRLFHIYKNLSARHQITLVTFTYPNRNNEVEVVAHGDSFQEIRVPKTEISKFLHYFVDRFSSIKECSAIVTSIESRFNKNFKNILKDNLKQSDIIIFVYPYLYTMSEKYLKHKKIVYESHNVEFDLMKQSLNGSTLGKILLRYVYGIERSLSKKSDLIFAVSGEDKLKLSTTYGVDETKIVISPNGVASNDYGRCIDKPLRDARWCIFVGSFHPPNIEAINNIINIAKQMPDIFFIVAGSAAQYYINSDIVEPSERAYSFRPIAITGFHDLEYWGTTPTMWSMPDFKILASDSINSIELRFYSPFSQRLKEKFGDHVECHTLKKGSNLLSIPLENGKDGIIYFSCEKSHSDRTRALGLAMQKIAYFREGREEYLDLTQRLNKPFTVKAAKNVVMVGQISDEEKLELYRFADVALNPMQSGSGTNIKMLDYMAACLPVISTPTGARGLDIENDTHAVICDLPDFQAKIRMILEDDQIRSRLIFNGRHLIRDKYDWERIAEDMDRDLRRLVE